MIQFLLKFYSEITFRRCFCLKIYLARLNNSFKWYDIAMGVLNNFKTPVTCINRWVRSRF